MLQSAVGNNNFSLYKKYSSIIDSLPPINIRDLLGYRSKEKIIEKKYLIKFVQPSTKNDWLDQHQKVDSSQKWQQ